MYVCAFRLSACFWFWHIKEWKGIFKVFEDLLEVCMRLGHLGKGREGVYGLGSLWRVVWSMEIGVIGVVKV